MEPTVRVAFSAAEKAGRIIRQYAGQLERIKITAKTGNDFVTEVDQRAEAIIIQSLREAFPDHSFLGEESGLIKGFGKGANHVWIIDPLDGTTNFLHGIPHVAVSIACQIDGKLEHGVVYNPFSDEVWYASRGRGAMYNNRRMRVSACKEMPSALIGTGFPFRTDQAKYMDTYLAIFRDLAMGTAGLRRPGSAALDLAYVASGRFDGFFEIGLQPWDLAAGALLVKEAGGLISDMSGGDDWLESGQMLCGGTKTFKYLSQVIRPHWNQFIAD